MRPTPLLLALLAGLVLCPPASAGVARVDVVTDGRYGVGFSHIVYEAAAGERNAVTITPAGGGGTIWLVHDDGAAVTAASGCQSVDARTARCAPAGGASLASFDVRTGDGDDNVRTVLAATDRLQLFDIDGGAGDDRLQSNGRLTGGLGDDTLEGGAGDDALEGGAGDDTLRGGDGADDLDGNSGDDLLDGGGGRDLVTYGRAGAVRVDLADARPDGGRGERDVLRAVEGVTGGGGDDVLRGSDGPDVLQGGRGDDVLDGRGGDDRIRGGSGRNVVDGGSGDDELASVSSGDRVRGGEGADRITALAGGARLDGGAGDDAFSISVPPAALACGRGRDRVFGLSLPGRPLITALEGCELDFTPSPVVAIAATPRRTDRAFQFAAQCRPAAASCTLRIALRLFRPARTGLELGSGTVTLRGGERGRVRVDLGAAARRALRTAPRALLQVRLRGNDRPGAAVAATPFAQEWRVRIVPPSR